MDSVFKLPVIILWDGEFGHFRNLGIKTRNGFSFQVASDNILRLGIWAFQE